MAHKGYDVETDDKVESSGGEAARRAVVDAVENLMRKVASQHTGGSTPMKTNRKRR